MILLGLKYICSNGKASDEGKLKFENLRAIALTEGEPALASGKQEKYEQLLSRYI